MRTLRLTIQRYVFFPDFLIYNSHILIFSHTFIYFSHIFPYFPRFWPIRQYSATHQEHDKWDALKLIFRRERESLEKLREDKARILGGFFQTKNEWEKSMGHVMIFYGFCGVFFNHEWLPKTKLIPLQSRSSGVHLSSTIEKFHSGLPDVRPDEPKSSWISRPIFDGKGDDDG